MVRMTYMIWAVLAVGVLALVVVLMRACRASVGTEVVGTATDTPDGARVPSAPRTGYTPIAILDRRAARTTDVIRT